ncbi:MAG: NADPH:quinone oxidoreductase family protein [Candidatus Hydrogenedentes bacterium]|nr:NADPH:quinone oxidoreductase family protein [Candidatus Hydrogenedentota bacterium]
MKTIVATAFGGPEVLEIREVPIPAPGPGEVRIQVRAAGINYADIMQREGLYPGGPKAPFGAGFEVAGVVVEAGDGVTQWRPGDEVMSFCQSGYSEYVVAKAGQVMPKPEQLSFAQAAAIPCQFLTAYHALLTLGRLAAGQTVLIQAAAGGLGTQLVQIARNAGATVIGTASTPEKCALIESLGCAHAINYKRQDFQESVKAITGSRGCDLVIESVGGEVFAKSLKCLKPRGMLVTLGIASKEPPVVEARTLLARNWIVAGFHLMAYTGDTQAMAGAMRDLHAWLLDGKLTVVVGHEFKLEEAARAHQFISDRKSSGKVVLVPKG